MSMAETFTVLARLVEDKVIDAYAIAGAVAAYNYIEAAVTDDLDVLIAVEKTGDSGLLTLAIRGITLDGIYGIPCRRNCDWRVACAIFAGRK